MQTQIILYIKKGIIEHFYPKLAPNKYPHPQWKEYAFSE